MYEGRAGKEKRKKKKRGRRRGGRIEQQHIKKNVYNTNKDQKTR